MYALPGTTDEFTLRAYGAEIRNNDSLSFKVGYEFTALTVETSSDLHDQYCLSGTTAPYIRMDFLTVDETLIASQIVKTVAVEGRVEFGGYEAGQYKMDTLSTSYLYNSRGLIGRLVHNGISGTCGIATYRMTIITKNGQSSYRIEGRKEYQTAIKLRTPEELIGATLLFDDIYYLCAGDQTPHKWTPLIYVISE